MLIKMMMQIPFNEIVFAVISLTALLAVLVGIAITIGLHRKAKKNQTPVSDRLKYNTVSMLCIAFSTIYLFLNFGWNRYILAFLLIVQAVLLIVGSNIASQYIKNSVSFQNLVVGNYILYIATHLILPDGVTSEMFSLFGLFTYSELGGHIAATIAQILLIVNIVLLIIEIILSCRLQKRTA